MNAINSSPFWSKAFKPPKTPKLYKQTLLRSLFDILRSEIKRQRKNPILDECNQLIAILVKSIQTAKNPKTL